MDQFLEHNSNIQLIKDTEAFLIEHSRLSEHDSIREKIKNLLDKYESTHSSEKVIFMCYDTVFT